MKASEILSQATLDELIAIRVAFDGNEISVEEVERRSKELGMDWHYVCQYAASMVSVTVFTRFLRNTNHSKPYNYDLRICGQILPHSAVVAGFITREGGFVHSFGSPEGSNFESILREAMIMVGNNQVVIVD